MELVNTLTLGLWGSPKPRYVKRKSGGKLAIYPRYDETKRHVTRSHHRPASRPLVTIGGLFEAAWDIGNATYKAGRIGYKIGAPVAVKGAKVGYKASIKIAKTPLWAALTIGLALHAVGAEIPAFVNTVLDATSAQKNDASINQAYAEDISNAASRMNMASVDDMKTSLLPQALSTPEAMNAVFAGVSDDAVKNIYVKMEQLNLYANGNMDTAEGGVIKDFYNKSPWLNHGKQDLHAFFVEHKWSWLANNILQPYSPEQIAANQMHSGLSYLERFVGATILSSDDPESLEISKNIASFIDQHEQLDAQYNTPNLRKLKMTLNKVIEAADGNAQYMSHMDDYDSRVAYAFQMASDSTTKAVLSNQPMTIVDAINELQHESFLFVPGISLAPDISQGMLIGAEVNDLPYSALYAMVTESGLRTVHAGKTKYASDAEGFGQMEPATWNSLWSKYGHQVVAKLHDLEANGSSKDVVDYHLAAQQVETLLYQRSSNKDAFQAARANPVLNAIATGLLFKENMALVQNAVAKRMESAEANSTSNSNEFDNAARAMKNVHVILMQGALYRVTHTIGPNSTITLINFELMHPNNGESAEQILRSTAHGSDDTKKIDRVIENNRGIFEHGSLSNIVQFFTQALPETTAHEILVKGARGELWARENSDSDYMRGPGAVNSAFTDRHTFQYHRPRITVRFHKLHHTL